MALQNGMYRAVVEGGAFGQQIINIFDYISDDGGLAVPPTLLEMEGLAAAVKTQFIANVLPLISVQYGLVNVSVTEALEFRVFSPSPSYRSSIVPLRRVFAPGPYGQDGGKLGESLPVHDAFSARKTSVEVGRFARGSTRFGPVAESDAANGQLAGGIQAAWDTVLGDLLLPEGPFAPGANTFLLCIFGPSQDVQPPGLYDLATLHMNVVTGYTINAQVRTQLSRRTPVPFFT